jgi:putative ABC transport system permease protein
MTVRLRRWRRNPLLAAHHIATITLGMAAVTAVVSLMLAMAFQPLPFRDSAQLIEVWNRVQSGAPVESLSGSELIEIQEQMGDMFTSLGGFTPLRLWLLDEQGSSAPLRIARLEEAAFRALDLTPVLGRPVARNTASPEGLGPVWISHNLWQTRYGGRSSVIGETIRLAQNDSGLFETRSEIAGVLPPDIQIPQPVSSGPVDLWAVLPDDFKVRAAKVNAFLALGRLRSDRTLDEAQAALTVLADRRPRPIDRRNRPIVQSFEEIAYGPARRTVGVMAVGVGLVLLLAFANLASLTVAEGSRRRLELSIRTSLGASRWRLWRDLVADHVALTVCALCLGLPLAWVTLRGLTRLVTVADIGPPLPQPPAVNVYVMLGFAASALAATLAWATLIVRGVDAADSNGDLRSGELSRAARLSPAERGAGLLRLAALSMQACLGIALMVLAISMARVYVRLTEVNLGPAPDQTVFFSVRPALGGVPTSAQAADFTSQVRSLVQSLPNVQAMAFADSFPPHASALSFWKQDDLAGSPRDATYPLRVSHDYFNTLGIPILFGRGFEESDRYAGKAVAIVDLEMARRNWGSPEEAVNAQIRVGSLTRGYEVIGVAGSFGGYWAPVPIPTIYLSQSQDPGTANAVIVRTDSSASSIAERARQVLSGMPVRVEMSAATTLQAGWQATATRPRARMVGMLLLALIGVGLGGQGVYALAASMVAARRRELAIRMALGATGPTLVWLLLRQLIVAVVIGSGLGVLGIFTLRRLAPQWISAAVSDPAASIALAIAVLLTTAVLGGFIPARSATRAPSVAWLCR